ncbi:hypothetical protein M409DRAFT_51728 [Zasmidium cellare ATCC 36951]|uniref:Uncharacterized protein n=1 Tax=Zasmidium cellare ATCC 36951 TaxID=1080233 RepID=A0A6A6CS75_ZASCE|nr:uncharacterized protein M409DRAFT_51728 [Zasmidium cellare ATCC 36951]KAF2169941.1 hypothetical protein M409DRAFT_51728 [Zasmidium cellare ATCC 36951]
MCFFKTRKQRQAPAHLTFHGPDSQDQITATNISNIEIARFTITKSTLSRLLPSSKQQQICTYKHSSLSGTTTLKNFHGHQQIKIKQSWEGMQYGKDIKSPCGKWKWRPGSGGCEELRDGKMVLARGKLSGGCRRRREARLEVFVNGDRSVMDLILASWATMVKERDGGTGAVAEVVGGMGGAVGGAVGGV